MGSSSLCSRSLKRTEHRTVLTAKKTFFDGGGSTGYINPKTNLMADSTSSDGAQQANMLDNENADTEYGMDGAEASMVKLVDGKLVPMGNTTDDVADDQLMNRYSDDDERGLQNPTDQKTYENSEAALHPEGPENLRGIDDNMAEAEITQTVGWATDPATMMVPTTPGAPDPYPSIPPTPDAPIPPTPPMPGPEIPDIPYQPSPGVSEPERSPDVNARITLTAGVPAGAPVGEGQYKGLTPGLDNEGMTDDPHTSSSERPYEPITEIVNDYQPGERAAEAAQMQPQPLEAMDESLSKKEQMDGGSYPADPAEEKSTDGLDRPYNDPQRR
jgi:hypothetical protein